MKRFSYLLLLSLALSAGAPADEPALKEFVSDGCSLFPDGRFGNPQQWCDCCLMHDLAYWRGGTKLARRQADEALRQCVARRTADETLADLMYRGVRGGGHPIFPIWYRWGYGWVYGRGYAPLNAGEQKQIEAKLRTYRARNPDFSCAARPPPLTGP